MNSILLVGLGNIGRRHLQGLVRCKIALRIMLWDKNKYALKQAIEDLQPPEMWGAKHLIVLCDRIEDCPKEVTILIDATSANNRGTRLNEILSVTNPKFAIIEKVLTQSIEETDMLVKALSKTQDSWVNYTRRAMSWHNAIKNQFSGKGPLKVIYSGKNWGLLCNSLHFIDMVEWWTDCKVSRIVPKEISLIDAKRIGFIEARGCISVEFYGGHSLSLYDLDAFENRLINVETNESKIYQLNEEAGCFIHRKDTIINGRCEYQSELTNIIVECILNKGKCNLPSLSECVATHNKFIASIIDGVRSNSVASSETSINIT